MSLNFVLTKPYEPCILYPFVLPIFQSTSLRGPVAVFIGRLLMSIWMGDAKIHELYTTACGLYTCWVTLRAGTIFYHWVPQGWAMLISRIKDWTILVSSLSHFFPLLGCPTFIVEISEQSFLNTENIFINVIYVTCFLASYDNLCSSVPVMWHVFPLVLYWKLK